MQIDPLARLWLAFCGLVFLLMGVSLTFDAEAHARAALAWHRASVPARRASDDDRLLTLAYRLFGASFSGIGLWLLIGLVAFGDALTSHLRGFSGAGVRTLGGALLLLVGGIMAALRVGDWRGPKHAFIDEELPAARDPLGRRVARWSGWLLTAAFLAFGAFLLSPFSAVR